jgi:hypothetical protein
MVASGCRIVAWAVARADALEAAALALAALVALPGSLLPGSGCDLAGSGCDLAVRSSACALSAASCRSKVVAAAPFSAFLRGLQRGVSARIIALPSAPTKIQTAKDSERVIEAAREEGAEVVVIGLQTGDHIAIVKAVQRALPAVKVVVVSFGSPWLINAFPDVDAYLCAFGWRDDSAAAAAAVVVGQKPARGRLPVVLTGGPAGDVVDGKAGP